jgi:two-component system chemotaxis sensor kinase CheA
VKSGFGSGRLIWKLYAGFLTVAFTGLAIAGALVDHSVQQDSLAQVRGRLDSEATMLGQMTASALFGEIDPSDTSLNESVRALADAVHAHLSVLTPGGVVVADSRAVDARTLPAQPDPPEIAAARMTGAGTAVRGADADERLFAARSIVREGKLLGFARSSISMRAVHAEAEAVRVRMAYGALVAVAVAILLGFFVSMGIVRPVRALADGAKRIGEGKYGHEIQVRSRDELGTLAVTFNDMSRSLHRTIGELDQRNRDMRVVLHHVGEGLLTLTRDGKMSREKSAVVERWFGSASQDAVFWDYIAPHDPQLAHSFRLSWQQLVEGVMPLEVCVDQMPKRVESVGRLFDLEYTPILAEGDLESVLVVVADVTAREQAMRAEADQREVLVVFERVMRDKNGFLDFLTEADALVAQISGELRAPRDAVKRALHTLKGNAGVFGVLSVARMCHDLESRLSEEDHDLEPGSREALRTMWRDFTQRLRQLLGERETRSIEVHDDEYEALLHALLVGTPRVELAEMIAEWKLERLDLRLERFAAQARSIAHRLEKGNADIQVECDKRLRLNRDAMAPFWSAFVHVIRNAVDHGLTAPQERNGVSGSIRFAARRAGKSMIIEVSDGGPGIDWPKVAERATSRGLKHQTHDDLVNAIFAEDFSTLDQVSETSGRGIGLGVVRRACHALGGVARVESKGGRGTTFQFELPADVVSRKPTIPAPLSAPPPAPI